jgi:hypothetical protein
MLKENRRDQNIYLEKCTACSGREFLLPVIVEKGHLG